MEALRSMFDLTVVVPCLNEEDNIVAAYQEIVAELGPDRLEVLFVDDGSTDSTLELIRKIAADDRRVSYVSFTRNFGIEAALCAGYRYASKPWLLHLDADLQFPPKEAGKLMEVASQGFDAVFGVRVDRADPWPRRAGSALTQFIARRLLGIELPRGATMFRLVRTELARKVVDLRLGTPYFLATLPRLTNAWATVPTEHRPRIRGRSKVGLRGLARHAVELFVSHSYRPLAIATVVCIGSSVIAAAGAVAVPTVGVGPAVGLLAAAVSLGLLAIAVLARYLGHIARNQPRPPLYLIRHTNLDVDPADLLEPA